MKKLFFVVLLSFIPLTLNAVTFDFNGKTSVIGGFSFTNNSEYLEKKDNMGIINLSQNLKLNVKPSDNIHATIDGTVGINQDGCIPYIALNELYIAIETEKNGNYYFGKRNHNVAVANTYTFANILYKNCAGFELNAGNGKWFDFTGGFIYDLSGSDIRNFNVLLRTNFFTKNISYNVTTFYLHILDFPKGITNDLFTDKDSFINKAKDYSDNRLEFVTTQTLNYKISDFNIYVESLIRTNPIKYDVADNKLILAKKHGYFDTTLGFSFDNKIVNTSLEYCYAMTGYNHNDIKEINKIGKTDPNFSSFLAQRNSYPIFYDNNIAITFKWNINDKWNLTAGDKISFAGFDCDPSFVGTAFYLGGEFKYSENISFNTKIEGRAGGSNSEYVLYERSFAEFTLGASLSF